MPDPEPPMGGRPPLPPCPWPPICSDAIFVIITIRVGMHVHPSAETSVVIPPSTGGDILPEGGGRFPPDPLPLPPGGRLPPEPLPPGGLFPPEPLPPGGRFPPDPLPPGGLFPPDPLPPGGLFPPEPLPPGGRFPPDPLPPGGRFPPDPL